MGRGYLEGVTHDYFRHGTTTLFAALNVLDGTVITQCKPRHRHQEFLAFLHHLDHNVPADLEAHLVADNYAPHKHPRVKAWLARHPRFHLHYTPPTRVGSIRWSAGARSSPTARSAAVRSVACAT
jgi:transposase